MVFALVLNKVVCKNKSCQTNFKYFRIANCSAQDIERDFNPDLLQSFQIDIEYPNLMEYINMLGWTDIGLPQEYPADYQTNVEFQEKLYHVLLCREIIDADLQCPTCEQCYHIQNKIVQMM